MHENKMLKVNLQMFNDGGTASGGEGATAQATEGALPKADKSGSSRRNSGEPKVVYGKQMDASESTTTIPAAEGVSEGNGTVTTSDSKEAKMAKFKEMVEGEYKDEFTSMFQDSFNRRFKDVKGLENSLSAQKPIIDMLMERHGITDGDMAKLQSAVEEDTQYWENRAEEEGLTVEQSKMMDKLKRENEELNKMQERQRNEMRAKAKLAEWARDGEAVKKAYPSFDFGAETKNPHFLGLLGKGVSVMDAYKLVHNDEIIEAEKRAAAQATGAQMEARIKSKASRPSENGMSSQSAAIVKKDTVSSLNKKDRAAIAKEVLRGGRITF